MVYDNGVYVEPRCAQRTPTVPRLRVRAATGHHLPRRVCVLHLARPGRLPGCDALAAIVAGIVNLWLVAVIMRRYVGIVEAIVSSLVYAVLPEAVYAEHTVVLEPWLNLACLSNVYLWLSVDRTAEWRRFRPRGHARGAGMLLGARVDLQGLGHLLHRGLRDHGAPSARRARLADLGVGTALGVAAWLPLLVVAPSEAVDQAFASSSGDRPTASTGPLSTVADRRSRPRSPTPAGGAPLRAGAREVGIFVAMRAATRLARLTVAWFS